MKLDAQTVKDLEIFQASISGTSIFELFDRTVTRDGRQKLHDRFGSPCSNTAEIRNEQDIVKFFLRLPSLDFFNISQSDLSHLEQYISSNYLIFDTGQGLFGSLKNRLLEFSEPSFVQFSRSGVVGVLAILQKTRTIFSRILADQDTHPKIQEFYKNFDYIDRQFPLESSDNKDFDKQLTLDVILHLDHNFRKILKENMKTLADNLAEIDCYISMAKATRDFHLSFPEILDSDETVLKIDDVYHPFVKNPRNNGFSNSSGKHVFFITGPNMAGKTTYLKACILAVILAQMGMGVPASRMVITPFSFIFCTLSSVDDIREGISSFCAEIRRVKTVLETLLPNERILVVFDELFKGTNVIDAFDCSLVVIEGFSHFPRHLFMISSHLLELADKLTPNQCISFVYFDAELREGKLHFEYSAQPGVNRKRFGFQILVQEGIPRFFEEKKKLLPNKS